MEWRRLRFDWNRARAFLLTAETGSLSAAARALGTTQPTVGRQIAALERELGVVLFELLTGRPLPPPGPDGFASVIDRGVVFDGQSHQPGSAEQAVAEVEAEAL